MPNKWNGPYICNVPKSKEYKEKKIFVQDHTDRPKPQQPIKEKEEEPEQVKDPKWKWKRMTAKRFIIEQLQGTTMSTEELARKYREQKHSNKLLSKLKELMSTTISILRKEGHPIIKIKSGRYGIRKAG